MRYPIAIETADDTHAYGVVVPDLPGCFSAGDTVDEAIANSEDAILHFEASSLRSRLSNPSAVSGDFPIGLRPK